MLLAESWVLVRADLGWLPWMAGVSVSAGVAILVGRDRALLAELRAAQAGLAERSRAEERNRIARDLHDVIAHSLTVSLLHISGARLALEHDPDDAARALAEAERLGRESLDEVRSIVGLMRSGDGAAANGAAGSLAPVPGLDGVGELVERFRGAGRGRHARARRRPGARARDGRHDALPDRAGGADERRQACARAARCGCRCPACAGTSS